jgi:hypothetical protein
MDIKANEVRTRMKPCSSSLDTCGRVGARSAA